VGCLAIPSPVHGGLLPKPFRCVTGGNLPSATCRATRAIVCPPRAPLSLKKRTGLANPIFLTLQGGIQDSSVPSGFAITNTVFVDVR